MFGKKGMNLKGMLEEIDIGSLMEIPQELGEDLLEIQEMLEKNQAVIINIALKLGIKYEDLEQELKMISEKYYKIKETLKKQIEETMGKK